MIETVCYLLAFLFVLSLVVVIHEGGHFMMARWCGVKVTDFSVGFGKELWGRVDKHGTRWKICAVPMGGYVKMFGDEDAASAKSSTENVPADQVQYTFMAQPLWKRALIIFAGPAMNYISAILLLAGILFFIGEVFIPPVVGQVMPDSAAAAAGLQEKDRILSINAKPVDDYRDIVRAVQVSEFGKSLTLEVARADETLSVVVQPKYDAGSSVPKLGIMAGGLYEVRHESFGILGALGRASMLAYETTVDTLVYLGQVLFKNRSANDMRGPLGIAEASGDAARGGLLSFLLFIVQISIAIGFMNLLPVPVLDGGHLAFYAVEAVRGKPLSEQVQNAFLWTGIMLLVSLMIFTLFLDVPRIIERIF